jgi:hypothetical protein
LGDNSTTANALPTPTATFNHAGALLRLGRCDEAQPIFEETIVTAQARQEDRIRFDAIMELGELHIEKGDLDAADRQLANLDSVSDGAADRARAAYRVALDNLRPTLGAGHAATQSAERALR